MSARDTWQAWLDACTACGGSSNGIRDGAGRWFYLERSRELQNGALTGRVHMHKPGQGMIDLGSFKIAADGRVVSVPEEVAQLLPDRAPAPPPAQEHDDTIEDIDLVQEASI